MNILKFFKRTKKEDVKNTPGRAPYKLFSGAIIPRRFIAEKLREAGAKKPPSKLPNKLRMNYHFQVRQTVDGDFLVCRVGKPIPAVGTFIFSARRYYCKSVRLA